MYVEVTKSLQWSPHAMYKLYNNIYCFLPFALSGLFTKMRVPLQKFFFFLTRGLQSLILGGSAP